MTLACEDASSKLVDAVTIADDDEGNNFLQICKLRFDQNLSFCSDLEHKVWSGF